MTNDPMQHPIVQTAMTFMINAHRNHSLSPDPVLGGQRRKFSGEHYEVHPIQVAKMVARSIHNDPVTIAVALLHDVVEDTTFTGEDVKTAFIQYGEDVAHAIMIGVLEVSDVSQLSDGNRAVRKEIDKLHSWKAAPQQQTIKLADAKSNMPSIVKHNPGFARKWVAEKYAQWEGFTEGDPELFEDMRVMFEKYYARQSFEDPEWEIV